VICESLNFGPFNSKLIIPPAVILSPNVLPTNSSLLLVVAMTNITGFYDVDKIGSSTTMWFDAGTNIALGAQFQIDYDFEGDGTFDRFEMYPLMALNNIVGYELAAADSLQAITIGGAAYRDFVQGQVKLTFWQTYPSSGGNVSLSTDRGAIKWQVSRVILPYITAYGYNQGNNNTGCGYINIPSTTGVPQGGLTTGIHFTTGGIGSCGNNPCTAKSACYDDGDCIPLGPTSYLCQDKPKAAGTVCKEQVPPFLCYLGTCDSNAYCVSNEGDASLCDGNAGMKLSTTISLLFSFICTCILALKL